jgi:hypothetical protein
VKFCNFRIGTRLAAGDRLATWAGAGVAALAMAGTVAGIDALMRRT